MSVMPAINVRLYPEQLAWLNDRSESDETTVSDVVRQCIWIVMERVGAIEAVDVVGEDDEDLLTHEFEAALAATTADAS